MTADRDPILQIRDLKVHFQVGHQQILRAVDGVSFDLRRGETLGLVGESGCGKSTTAKAILHVVRATSGSARLDMGDGTPEWLELTSASRQDLRRARQSVQLIFQDPYASLNPRMTVGDIVAEPMRIFRLGSRSKIQSRVQELMVEVGLDAKFIKRYPHEFSGGQRQRIGIARALALDPKIIICDEPVSALDVSIRSQVINLLMELQKARGLSYLFIAHDLSVVKHISHRVAVMYLGKIVEEAPYDQIYRAPKHPYTEALLSAIPIPDPKVEAVRQRILLSGDLPKPTDALTGCGFASRCPKALAECTTVEPRLAEIDTAHHAACLLYPESGSQG